MLYIKKHFALSNTQTRGYSKVIGNLIIHVITMKKRASLHGLQEPSSLFSPHLSSSHDLASSFLLRVFCSFNNQCHGLWQQQGKTNQDSNTVFLLYLQEGKPFYE